MEKGKMSMLTRADLVGRSIQDVYQSEYVIERDGYGGCQVYVLLESGVAFELLPDDPGVERSIARVDLSTMRVTPACFPENTRHCRGEKVIEVVRSNFWMCFGLLLSSNRLLVLSDRSTPRIMGPCLFTVGSPYEAKDFIPLWASEQGQSAV